MSIIEDISDFFKNILGFLKTIILLFIDKINPSSWSFIEENKEKRNVYSGLFIFTLSTLIIYFIYFIFKKAITLSRNNFLDSKYNLIFNILFLFFYISTLYFFIFRKKNDTSEDNYFNFIEKNNNKEFIFGINERNFNSNIFNEKILSPFKFIMLNLFALLFIGFFIAGFSNIFVSFLKDFSNSKNIIKSLILLSITITILMILAKIFSVTLSDTLCNNVKDDIFKK